MQQVWGLQVLFHQACLPSSWMVLISSSWFILSKFSSGGDTCRIGGFNELMAGWCTVCPEIDILREFDSLNTEWRYKLVINTHVFWKSTWKSKKNEPRNMGKDATFIEIFEFEILVWKTWTSSISETIGRLIWAVQIKQPTYIQKLYIQGFLDQFISFLYIIV